MASPYPGTIALDSGTNRPIRGQYPSLINALRNPQLSVDGERPPVPEESGPSTEASDVPPDPSVQSLRDLAIVSPDVASQEQDTARATKGTATSDGKSDSRSGSLCLLTDDKASKGTARPVHTEHDLVHMAPWVEDSLHNLKTAVRQHLSSRRSFKPDPGSTHFSPKLSQANPEHGKASSLGPFRKERAETLSRRHCQNVMNKMRIE